jgi:hypothetical protein
MNCADGGGVYVSVPERRQAIPQYPLPGTKHNSLALRKLGTAAHKPPNAAVPAVPVAPPVGGSLFDLGWLVGYRRVLRRCRKTSRVPSQIS